MLMRSTFVLGLPAYDRAMRCMRELLDSSALPLAGPAHRCAGDDVLRC